MRLLSTRTRELREFFDDERPPYAILSHRWLSQEEVSFRELSELYCASENGPETGPIASRSGYLKIQGCRQQALQDGFDWVWIDTCCIDKSSSAELSEAINSMFNWYKDSDICYAYLTDVPDATDDITQPESAFRMSQWFLRGWTLQELLAPRKVRFLDASWNSIGDLQEGTVLLHVVSEVSRISPEYLTGQPMETASIARRMSWASRRRTTRKEDIAYCLLGIFDVNMPLLYGEGDKAFVRLQEEIMKHTTDHTILAWGVNSGKRNFGKTLKETSPEECHEYGVLARSPADFADSSNFMPCGSLVRSKTSTFTLTEKGLWIHCFHEKLPNPSRLFHALAFG
ncbi:heterokaryon incompatibility protein-domain-containing protein [Xylariomycetidae sp. FL0641]|nr:heterokaryon incompatibility protein-domain-containing protein [Xylariomycetidae sp. FL0641]